MLLQCNIFLTDFDTNIPIITFPLLIEKEIIVEGRIIGDLKKDIDKMYFTTEKGFLYCFDLKRKDFSWKFNIEEEILTPPYIGKDYIYFKSKDKLFCVNKNTGKLVWEKDFQVSKIVYLSKINEYLYIAFNKMIQVRESKSGKILREYKLQQPINSELISWENNLIFLSKNGMIYLINKKGNPLILIKISENITSKLLKNKAFLYFGSDNYFYCYNLKKRKLKWKIRTGGRIVGFPVVDKKRIYLVCLNNVLYCINKKGGDILWWKSISSRVPYQLYLARNFLLVSTLSNDLLAFRKENGERIGKFKVSKRILNTNPLINISEIIIGVFEPSLEHEKLLILKKKIAVKITANKSSPQKIGEEIVFKANAVGLIKPQFEFYLKSEEMDSFILAQELSFNDEFSWFPEEEGIYIIKVIAKDKENKVENSIQFKIEK